MLQPLKKGCSKLVGLSLGIISFGGSSWQSSNGELIDLLHAPNQSWVKAALDAPIQSTEGLQVIDLPYLLILKIVSDSRCRYQ